MITTAYKLARETGRDWLDCGLAMRDADRTIAIWRREKLPAKAVWYELTGETVDCVPWKNVHARMVRLLLAQWLAA